MPDVPTPHDLEALLTYLRDSRGADFTGYKRPSLTRLVNRRMRTVGVSTYQEYTDLLQAEGAELAALLDTLLVSVTSLFRDPDAWDVLRTQLLPQALRALARDEPVRVWSAACATGEEAYSLAILLHEVLGDDAYRRRVKVYATDVDEQALAVARAGRYPRSRLEQLTDHQREKYFEPDGDELSFRGELRSSLIFGRHDLLANAPISRVLLLSCRNVLMYFTPETQAKVLERFSWALHPEGLLLLGKAEMLLTQAQLFTPVSLPQRVFRARRPPSAARLGALAVGAPTLRESDVARVAEVAFDAAPAAQVVLDAQGVVALVNARAEHELGLSPADLGRPFGDLVVSYRPVELRGVVASASASREPVELRDVGWSDADGAECWWDVVVAPLLDGEGAERDVIGVHLVFEDVTERHELRSRLDQLDHELTTAYQELRSSSEELETTNEELQSAVEELETTNEELQSTNEELETMNEELQSTNEELQTLNDELRDRTLEVDQVNDFLQGILSGLETAVVVVDVDYRVQLWNSGAERLTGLRAFEAQGQRVLDLPVDVPADDLRALLGEVVLRGGRPDPVTVAVTNRFGRPAQRRVSATPLRRGGAGDVTGAVLTVSDDDGRAA